MITKKPNHYKLEEDVVNLDYGTLCSKKTLCELPLTHQQSWDKAQEIIAKKCIIAEPCDVFIKERLVYFFYGRPAYTPDSHIGKTKSDGYYPVCFLVRSNAIKISKVFPFDSGAYALGYYSDYLNPSTDINKASLPPSTGAIKNYISFYFGSNYNYYKDKFNKNTIKDNMSEMTKKVEQLLNSEEEKDFDERYSSVEVITKDDVCISNNLVAIVLPDDIKRKYIDEIDKMKIDNVEIITYNTFGGTPSGYHAVIRDKVYDFLCSKGMITTDELSY